MHPQPDFSKTAGEDTHRRIHEMPKATCIYALECVGGIAEQNELKGTQLKMTTSAVRKTEAGEALQHTADAGGRGTYGERFSKMRCPLFE